MKSLFFSVVIPAYNEEKTIVATIKAVENYFRQNGIAFEIIIVDDGSLDNTVKLISENFKNEAIRIIEKKRNEGKGAAIKDGILNSKGDYILFTDSDLSTPITEFGKFTKYIQENYDVIIGSRALPGSRVVVRQPFYREALGKIFNLFVKFFLFKGINDTQCGFKLFKGVCAKEIFKLQRINDFGFDIEILFVAGKMNFKIAEVPVVWHNRPSTRLNIIKDSLGMFFDIFKILRNYKKGFYAKD